MKAIGTVLVALLAGPALAALVTPTAAAHACSGDDPLAACGDCKDPVLSHNHTYTDGRTYCSSRGILCQPQLCLGGLP